MGKKADATKLDDEIYLTGKFSPFRLTIIFIILLLALIISNLSLGSKITAQLDLIIKGTPDCPFTHSGVEFSWFLPSIEIKNPSLPASCFNRRKGPALKLKTVPIYLNFPSVYPFGLKFHTEIKPAKGKSDINLYPIFGIKTHYLKITDTTIDDQLLAEIFGRSIFDGEIQVESNLQLDSTGPQAGDLLVKSKNLQIKSQSIEGLTIPQMRINNLQLKANLNKTKLSVISFILGDEQSPIYGSFTGNIRVNKYNFSSSKLELEGEIKFSPDFINAFPAINLFLSGKDSQGGLYRVQINGTVGAPMPRIL